MTNISTIADVLLKEEETIYAEDLTIEDKAVLNNIGTLINELRGHGIGGKDFSMYTIDELSRIAGSLALLKDYLVDLLVKSSRKKRIQEAKLKLSKGNIRNKIIAELTEQLGKKPTGDDIKGSMEKHLFRARARLAYLEELSDKMLYKWRSINSLLDVMKSRINALSRQHADTPLMDDSLDINLNNISN